MELATEIHSKMLFMIKYEPLNELFIDALRQKSD